MPANARTLLDRLPAARTLGRRERRRALRLLDIERLEPGAVLYHQADPPEQMALLLSGRLLASTLTSDDTSIPLGRIRAGEVIGEMGLLDGAPRSATVTCEYSAVLLVLHRHRFHELEASADPILAWLLNVAAKGMALRIGAMSERIAQAAVEPEVLHALPRPSAHQPQSLWTWLEALRGQR